MSSKTLLQVMRFLLLLLTLPVLIESEFNTTIECPNVKNSLGSIRKRRHLTFPEGTNLVLTVSTVKTFLTHVPSGWYFVMELDLVYPIPNHNITVAHRMRRLHHRQKREFWDKLSEGFTYHNLNGRACVLRSVCEANRYLAPPGRSLVHDLLRVIFTAPMDEEDFADEVRLSYNELFESDFCNQQYLMNCPFSLVNFILSLNKQLY